MRNNQDFAMIFNVIKANSTIITISQNDWIMSAQERFNQRKTEKDFGLIDAMLLVKQKELRCMLISGDKHFRDKKDIIFLE